MMQQPNDKKRHLFTRRITLLAAAALFLQTSVVSQAPAHAADATTVVYKGEDILTSGAILKHYDFSTVRSGSEVHTNMNVIEVALNNPLVKLDVMTGTNNEFTKKQSIRGMANETGAVGGTNGDFYNTQAEGVPIGPEISNGNLMATPPYTPGLYSFGITNTNKPVVDLFTFQGSIVAPDGASYALGGINKTYYWFEPSGQHSMIDGLFMYTSAWGQEDRSNDGVTVPTEILVENGIVKQIAPDNIIHQIAPNDGYILRSSGKAATFMTTHFKVGDKIVANYKILSQDPTKSYTDKDFKMMIGGHTILVDQGQATPYSRPDVNDLAGYRSRTAIGYSKDEKYAYLITADRSGSSMGMSLPELAQAMIKVGVWKGLLLDGGGSTQMVARPLGETSNQLVNQTENGNERAVVNGLGVYTLAPKGDVLSVKIVGEDSVFMNEKTPYQVNGYDIYYNPVTTGSVQAQWSASSGGTFQDNVFTPNRVGNTTITAVSGQAKQTMDVQVVGRQDIDSLQIQASNTVLTQGADIKLSVLAKLKNGKERTVPADSFQWEVRGFKGTVTGDTLHVDDISGTTSGQLIARYDGFGTILPMNVGYSKLWANFDSANPAVSLMVTPNAVKGDVSRVSGYQGLPAGNNAIKLSYDMTAGTGTKAVYARFGTGNGLPVEGNPQSMVLNVYGDNSLNWLRAEVVDADGNSNLVDLARYINWTGWKTISADFTRYNMKYPVTIKRIYVANIAQGQDERAAVGEIGLDDISFLYKTASTETPRNPIKLTINNPNVTVNGKVVPLSPAPAPYILNGNTMVPLRFVTEALGGEVFWNNDERKATIIRGGQLADLWLNQVSLDINGHSTIAEVAPELKNESTMVPLRILSEGLGWKVSWDQSTYTVTME